MAMQQTMPKPARFSSTSPVALQQGESLASTPRRRLIDIAEVGSLTGLSRATIYNQIKAGAFPRPVQITARRVGWVEGEIAAYVEGKIAARDAALGA